MLAGVAVAAAVAVGSATGFESKIEPLPGPVQARLEAGGFWKPGCPVALSRLRLLTVTHRDWRGRPARGQLVVNVKGVYRLRRVFARLYGLNFPIRTMRFSDYYGPNPKSDVTASFHCRQAVSSPCTGGKPSGRWSNHAYGLAVDVNPRENPYVGCGMSYNRSTRIYMDRSRHRKGMLTRRAIAAFASVGWEWGGAWAGNTKDYMHFSHNGR